MENFEEKASALKNDAAEIKEGILREKEVLAKVKAEIAEAKSSKKSKGALKVLLAEAEKIKAGIHAGKEKLEAAREALRKLKSERDAAATEKE